MNKYTDLGSRVTRSMTPDITNRMSKPQTYASFNTGLMNYEFRKQMT